MAPGERTRPFFHFLKETEAMGESFACQSVGAKAQEGKPTPPMGSRRMFPPRGPSYKGRRIHQF
jgi:hypothetical protein